MSECDNCGRNIRQNPIDLVTFPCGVTMCEDCAPYHRGCPDCAAEMEWERADLYHDERAAQ